MRLEDFPDEICEWCGTGFTSARGRIEQRFCCRECRDAAKLARSKHPAEVRTCPQCGGQFTTTRINQQKYCSERCRYIYGHAFAAAVVSEERRRARAGRTCAQCGNLFDAGKGEQIYCSKKCLHSAVYDKHRMRQGKTPLAEALAALRCQECGGPIPGAKSTRPKYCPTCKRTLNNERTRLLKRQMRAEKRFRNPYGTQRGFQT